ncbi:UNKNOWN [Stylonychia lemnae]|uniref:RRM domain-containing protein n=1 Tax=Stylonychia lemnae TaxID=5949 RepID=A0A078A1L4_STYLE|nr:UNKNOWN [Stylonychia lemnae]|eukprot:CDW76000.1 UNKNOWN [Stylonychia lemnae]
MRFAADISPARNFLQANAGQPRETGSRFNEFQPYTVGASSVSRNQNASILKPISPNISMSRINASNQRQVQFQQLRSNTSRMNHSRSPVYFVEPSQSLNHTQHNQSRSLLKNGNLVNPLYKQRQDLSPSSQMNLLLKKEREYNDFYEKKSYVKNQGYYNIIVSGFNNIQKDSSAYNPSVRRLENLSLLRPRDENSSINKKNQQESERENLAYSDLRKQIIQEFLSIPNRRDKENSSKLKNLIIGKSQFAQKLNFNKTASNIYDVSQRENEIPTYSPIDQNRTAAAQYVHVSNSTRAILVSNDSGLNYAEIQYIRREDAEQALQLNLKEFKNDQAYLMISVKYKESDPQPLRPINQNHLKSENGTGGLQKKNPHLSLKNVGSLIQDEIDDDRNNGNIITQLLDKIIGIFMAVY